ncbi:MAG: twitching motility protein PilT [Acetivibrio ethanolgignens]
MIQIIAGEKGKGKTKILLEKVNTDIKTANGNVVYLDKSTKHMYELNNKVRLINVKDFLVSNYNEFLGFICGIISQDHDLEKVYLDSFLKVACVEEAGLEEVLTKLTKISEAFHIDFVLSVSLNKEQIPESVQKDIIVAL